MKEQKRVLTMSEYEYRLAMYGLIHFRNQLLAPGRYTDAVDELIFNIQTKSRRVRRSCKIYKNFIHIAPVIMYNYRSVFYFKK